jgi:hypothetical protein
LLLEETKNRNLLKKKKRKKNKLSNLNLNVFVTLITERKENDLIKIAAKKRKNKTSDFIF